MKRRKEFDDALKETPQREEKINWDELLLFCFANFGCLFLIAASAVLIRIASNPFYFMAGILFMVLTGYAYINLIIKNW